MPFRRSDRDMDLDKLKLMIGKEKYKVISFDIFDTLLVRPCLQPTDLLKLVGLRCGYDGNYLEMRRAAEKRARKECLDEEIRYDDIYKHFANIFSFSSEEIERFKAEELKIERQYLYARQAMKQVFDFAVSIGKRVILISDMYLPKQVILEILDKNGFVGFQQLFLSSEYGKMKSTGHLYDIVLETLDKDGIKPSEVLHMGDNERSDVLIPESKKIKCVFIPRTNWLLRKNRKLSLLYNNMERKLDNSFLVGFSANLTFNDPFRPYHINTYFYGSRYSAANMLFGPFLLGFIKWVLEDCIQNEIDTLCMVYRDGYLPEKIFDHIKNCYKNVPRISRLYLTRAMINRFYSTKKNGLVESINDMLYSDNMTVSEFIKERLFVTDEDQYQEVLALFIEHGYQEEMRVGRRDDLTMWINELDCYFQSNAIKSVEDIKQYCKEVLRDCGKLAVYDVGYRGSVCAFLKNYLGISSRGYHLFAKENLRSNKNIDVNYAVMYGILTEKETQLINCFTEDLLNANEASVNNIERCADGAYTMVRDDNYVKDEGMSILQDYIIEYTKGFSELFREDMQLLHFDLMNYFEFYKHFLVNATPNDTKLCRRTEFIDSMFMNPRAKNVYKQWEMFHRFKSSSDRVLFEIQESVWNISVNIDYRLKPAIMLVGNPKTLSKNELISISEMKKEDRDVCVYLLMETSEHSAVEYCKWGFQNVHTVSKIDMPRGYDRNVKIDLTDEMQQLISDKKYLQPFVQQLYDKHSDMGKGYPEAIICYWYWYFYKVIYLYNQDNAKVGFLVWDQHSIMHQLLKEICAELNVLAEFVERGFERKVFDNLKEEIIVLSKKMHEKRRMRIAVYASMPRKGYSGGRTHALNLAECLSHQENEVYFISRYLPMFLDEMKDNKGHERIHFISTDDLNHDKTYMVDMHANYFDYLIIVPHRDKNPGYYMHARNLAKRMNAKLVLLNYETPNWMNHYLKEKQNEAYWKPWKDVCEDGCMILCSDKESVKYAEQYYVDYPENTRFDYWYPTINSLVADKVIAQKENSIIAFVRPGDVNKGTRDILQLLDDKLQGYKVVLICGQGLKNKEYFAFCRQLDKIKSQYGINLELKIQPADYEKFLEITKAKIMLFPSYFEGYGTPPIEAQYCNTLCLVYDLPVLRETCGDGVVYCEYGNVQDMKNKLTQLITQDSPIKNLRDRIFEIANFEKCAERLDFLFRQHLSEDWRKMRT